NWRVRPPTPLAGRSTCRSPACAARSRTTPRLRVTCRPFAGWATCWRPTDGRSHARAAVRPALSEALAAQDAVGPLVPDHRPAGIADATGGGLVLPQSVLARRHREPLLWPRRRRRRGRRRLPPRTRPGILRQALQAGGEDL